MTSTASDPATRRKGRYIATAGDSFGGQYVAPNLLPILDRIEAEFDAALADPAFAALFTQILVDQVGRPTPLMRLDGPEGGAALFLKREDLTNTGGSFGAAVLGQCLLAKRMGLRSVVADTGSGDHGVALASIASRLGLQAVIYIADGAARSQGSMVARMQAFGASVVPVPGDDALLHHAMSGAIQHWMGHDDTCLYVAGAPIGPHPYPAMVRHFQSAIGHEVREQVQVRTGALPTALVAALDGGGAAAGLFAPFLDEPVRLAIAEPGGNDPAQAAAPLSHGTPGVLHGAYTLVVQDGDGQLRAVQSAAPGASYPAAGPELAAWVRRDRIELALIPDAEALATMQSLAATQGVLISLESALGLALAQRLAATLGPTDCVVCAINADGTKDVARMIAA